MDFGEEVTLAVLAGGEGSRLGGVAKPLMLLEGKPLLVHLLSNVRAREALVLTRTPHLYEGFGDGFGGFGARVICDKVPNGGPLAGLDAALAEARTEWVALVAGDMPWLRQDVLEVLAEAAGTDPEWCVFAREDRREPLPGLYRRSLRARLPSLLGRGAGLMALLSETPGAEVDVERLRPTDPDLQSLRGVNTPEEARRYGVTLPRTKP